MRSASSIHFVQRAALLLLVLFGRFPAFLQAQQAPLLRCLEVVNTSGDVRLSWIAPADPQNNYSGFEVYFSSLPQGPYTQVFSGPAAITVTNFVHTTTVSTAQPAYYFMRALFAAGTSTSANSDTLKTIFLNINTTLAETYRLFYDAVHVPLFSSSTADYEIYREFPAGTWNLIAKTPALSFDDTLSLCNKAGLKIRYQLKIPDNNGCTSVSNVQGGVYSDQHAPYELVVDSISVLPNGNTVLAWKKPWDKDVVVYEMQRRVGVLNDSIDAVFNPLATSYTLSDNAANSGTVGLFVKAIDSCGNGALVDYAPVTMYLQTAYDYCKFESQLSWNHYMWPTRDNRALEELLEYQVFVSTDSGATFSRLGTTNTNTYLHKNVPTNKHLLYFVRVLNKNNTMTASSNRSGFFSGEVRAPDFAYIKTATVIKKNTIEVHLYLEPGKYSQGLEVERSDDGITWSKAGNMNWTAAPNYTFVDENVSTEHHSYYYRVLVRDSCGNLRLESNTARTILLKVSADNDNVFQRYLSWNDYRGFDAGVREYLIYRAVNDIGVKDLLGKVDSATFEFADNIEFAAPLGARIEYLVQASEANGNRYGIWENASSNFHPAYMEAKIFVPNAFAPAGINKTWKPVNHFVDRLEYNVTVFNRWGQTVYEGNTQSEAWNGAGCEAGVYAYIIFYRNSRGEYQEEKGHVTLIR